MRKPSVFLKTKHVVAKVLPIKNLHTQLAMYIMARLLKTRGMDMASMYGQADIGMKVSG